MNAPEGGPRGRRRDLEPLGRTGRTESCEGPGSWRPARRGTELCGEGGGGGALVGSKRPRPNRLRKLTSSGAVITPRRASSWVASFCVWDQLAPTSGPSQLRAEPTRRSRTIRLQRLRLLFETTASPVPAAQAHSQAFSTPSRRTCTTASRTELAVNRPRHSSPGQSDAVLPEQNRMRRMGTSSATAPVDRSVTFFRYRQPCGRTHLVESHRSHLGVASSIRARARAWSGPSLWM